MDAYRSASKFQQSWLGGGGGRDGPKLWLATRHLIEGFFVVFQMVASFFLCLVNFLVVQDVCTHISAYMYLAIVFL